MNLSTETSRKGGARSISSPNHLLATVTSKGATLAAPSLEEGSKEAAKDGDHAWDFRNHNFLSRQELSKLRLNQEEFALGLAAQLSSYLRLDFSVKLTRLETIAHHTLASRWCNPSHYALFKLEPMRGISVLEIPLRLGLSMVDRLMGGRGEAPDLARELSEIERALLEQVVQLILGTWCGHWSKLKELKPVLLGHETNSSFIQTADSKMMMLVLTMETRVSNSVEVVRIAFPFSSLDPLIRHLIQGSEAIKEAVSQPVVRAPAKWNPCFDNVCVPITAECPGLELTARDVLALKAGDVLPLAPLSFQQVRVCLADRPKFNGRLGIVSGNWAVELTETVNRPDSI